MAGRMHDRAACELCVNADTLGWWGTTKVTHCRECGNTWSRTSRTVECVRCHRLFGGHTTADLHTGPGLACLDPETVGLVPRTGPYGETVFAAPPPVWRRP